VPASATKLRLVQLAEKGSGLTLDAILDWVWGERPVEHVLSMARDSLPAFDAADEKELLDRVEELSRTVASLTGMNLVAEVLDDLKQAEDDGRSVEDFEPPDLDSMYGGEEPSELEMVAGSNSQMAYVRGKQDEDAETDDWWEFEVDPFLKNCEICGPLDGVQAPQDDDIWTDRIPPIHPRCGCRLRTIPPQKIKATEDDIPEESRGVKGWGNPQERFDPDLSDKPTALLPLYHDHLRNLRRNE
jgi:hypothetical protein